MGTGTFPGQAPDPLGGFLGVCRRAVEVPASSPESLGPELCSPGSSSPRWGDMIQDTVPSTLQGRGPLLSCVHWGSRPEHMNTPAGRAVVEVNPCARWRAWSPVSSPSQGPPPQSWEPRLREVTPPVKSGSWDLNAGSLAPKSRQWTGLFAASHKSCPLPAGQATVAGRGGPV